MFGKIKSILNSMVRHKKLWLTIGLIAAVVLLAYYIFFRTLATTYTYLAQGQTLADVKLEAEAEYSKILSDQQEFNNFWSQIVGEPNAPEVNFAESTVVLLLGNAQTSEIEITDIKRNFIKTELLINVQNCSASTSPIIGKAYAFAVISHSVDSPNFQTTISEIDCTAESPF